VKIALSCSRYRPGGQAVATTRRCGPLPDSTQPGCGGNPARCRGDRCRALRSTRAATPATRTIGQLRSNCGGMHRSPWPRTQLGTVIVAKAIASLDAEGDGRRVQRGDSRSRKLRGQARQMFHSLAAIFNRTLSRRWREGATSLRGCASQVVLRDQSRRLVNVPLSMQPAADRLRVFRSGGSVTPELRHLPQQR
jgi:hypothetical protein